MGADVALVLARAGCKAVVMESADARRESAEQSGEMWDRDSENHLALASRFARLPGARRCYLRRARMLNRLLDDYALEEVGDQNRDVARRDQ